MLPKYGSAPEAGAPEHRVTIVQFAKIRGVEKRLGGFAADCRRHGISGRRAVAEWDRLFDAYWDRPVKG